MLYGLLNLSLWGYVIATLILTHITIASVTIFLHRCQSHRALKLHPIVSHFFRFWLWLTTGMITKEWVAIHRKHHAKCEQEDDPHSPQIFGIRKVLLEGAELYRAEAENKETLEKYGRGTPDDWLERHIYSRHQLLGIAMMFIIDILLFGIPGITVWAVQMIWIPFFAAGVINGVGHYIGYRNHECPDASRNIVPWGILIGGEELHNNHHTFPNSAKLSFKWWEFDIGWLYIRGLSLLGLAKNLSVPPKMLRVPNKHYIDMETVYAILTNRFQVLSRYSKEVILPVLKEEQQRANDASKRVFKRAKRLLTRETMLVDENNKQRLSTLFEHCQRLHQVYQFRLRLQAIWDRAAANQKESLEALQEWCHQAEATGIEALRQFSHKLKTYAV